MTLDWFVDVAQIIFADIILSGDNALVIGMAAAGLSANLRKRAIFIGMAVAAGLRIVFAVVASYLLAIKGILIIGGLLLAWVCWRFYNDLREFNAADADALEQPEESEDAPEEGSKDKQFTRALFTILLADVSMSIDNIVAVAAIARDNTQLLVFGLALAIAFMAFFASIIMRIMLKFRWLSYLGLFFLIYLTGMMLYDGVKEFGLI
ncbi:MAG: YjbE family putative metal transport protein [Candidatus Puniceispirillaceae bacterium]